MTLVWLIPFIFYELILGLRFKIDSKVKLPKWVVYGEDVVQPKKLYISSGREVRVKYVDKAPLQNVIQTRIVGLKEKIRRMKFEIFGNPNLNMVEFRKRKQDYMDDNYLLRVFKINRILELEEFVNFNKDYYNITLNNTISSNNATNAFDRSSQPQPMLNGMSQFGQNQYGMNNYTFSQASPVLSTTNSTLNNQISHQSPSPASNIFSPSNVPSRLLT
jgi:hypothetical protein